MGAKCFSDQKQVKCLVLGCNLKHKKHFCRVCQDKDSSHYARDCPNGRKVYHGTKKQYAQIIQKNQFAASINGRIGDGVYFTLNFKQAQNIAKYKYGGQNPVVIECKVKMDNAITDKHPSWANNKAFIEACVSNPKRVRVIKVHSV